MLVVDVFTDPSCPWSWITSRWLKEVAPQRDLKLRWRSYSLEIRDGGALPPTMTAEDGRVALEWAAASHRALRVFEALRARAAEDAIDSLYTEWGYRSTALVGSRARCILPGSPPPSPPPGLLLDCMQACGLDTNLTRAGDDPTWDGAIVSSMEEAWAIAGPKAQTPTLVLRGDPPRGLKGPVMSPAPTGKPALRLWTRSGSWSTSRASSTSLGRDAEITLESRSWSPCWRSPGPWFPPGSADPSLRRPRRRHRALPNGVAGRRRPPGRVRVREYPRSVVHVAASPVGRGVVRAFLRRRPACPTKRWSAGTDTAKRRS